MHFSLKKKSAKLITTENIGVNDARIYSGLHR